MALAMNPNTPRTALVRMIESQSSAARLAAFGYGKLPEDERHGYLRKGCSFTTANLLITIAKDSATPEEVLKCLGESLRGMCRSGESRYAHRNSRGNEQVNRPSEIALWGAGVAKAAGWRNELQSKLAQGSPRGL
jgi:hypothetical protein